MKKLILSGIGLLIVSFISAQSIDLEVIGTADGNFENTTYQLDWTIGEVATETISNGTHTLTQGFHQSNENATAIEKSETLDFNNSYGDKFKISKGYSLQNDNFATIKNTGEVGIGTSNPTSTLHVVGGTKIGAKGVKIGEIIEITGTTNSSSTVTRINYPTGFNQSNTRVLSSEIKNSGWTSSGRVIALSGAPVSIFTTLEKSTINLFYPSVRLSKNPNNYLFTL